jgi:hypothetical protein
MALQSNWKNISEVRGTKAPSGVIHLDWTVSFD